jgi:dTDP-4-amino-4,6-dideoxygalactose transaminase
MGGTEQDYVRQAFESNWIAPLGPNVEMFEKALESYIGEGTHVAALSSGTGAIHLALDLLGVSSGDEVLCQSFTFSASANPIMYLGATPIFIDSEPNSWNISPSLLEKAILSRIANGIKPKAIIAVHLYGMPYQADAILEISKRFGIPVVEDSAEALGSRYKDQKCGSFGDISILSFNGNKIITTSGGGALVSRNEQYRDKAIFLSTQARDDAPHYQHSHVGYNYRMSNVLAGIGRGQMEVLDERVVSRRKNYEFYKEHLQDYNGLNFLEEPEGFYSNRWLSCMLTPSFEIREKIRLALLEEDIESRPLWKPLHMQPIFEAHMNFTDGTSEELFQNGLCLPSGSNLRSEDLTRIVSIIKKTLL